MIAEGRSTRRLRRAGGIVGAFFRMGFTYATNYPLGFWIGQIAQLVPIFIYYFVAQLVPSQPAVGNDYFTFVVLGLIGMMTMSAGLTGFSTEMDAAMSQGHFEMLLVEPLPWRLLPFAMSVWPGGLRIMGIAAMSLLSTALGAQYLVSGIPLALLFIALGIAAGLAIGILASSVKLLAKKGDPVLTIYLLATQVLSGQFFSVEQLPEPLRVLAYTIPQTYVNLGLRRVLMPDGASIGGLSTDTALLVLIGFVVVLSPVAIWLFGRSMEYGRTMGVLSGY